MDDIRCYEFFGCKKRECVMFAVEEEVNCWDLEATLTSCRDMFGESGEVKDKILFCKNCLYYTHVNQTKESNNLSRFFA